MQPHRRRTAPRAVHGLGAPPHPSQRRPGASRRARRSRRLLPGAVRAGPAECSRARAPLHGRNIAPRLRSEYRPKEVEAADLNMLFLCTGNSARSIGVTIAAPRARRSHSTAQHRSAARGGRSASALSTPVSTSRSRRPHATVPPSAAPGSSRHDATDSGCTTAWLSRPIQASRRCWRRSRPPCDRSRPCVATRRP